MSKEKYLQIFEYLKEFSKIRSITIRDIEAHETHYPEKIWLNDIPDNKVLENIIRSNFDQSNDYWLKVTKPKEPVKPEFARLSENLEKWLDKQTLLNDEDGPKLKNTIEDNEEKLLIDDYPEVQKEYIKYIEEKWIDDLIDYNTQLNKYKKDYALFEKLNNIYKQLFLLFNKSQQFGEEYELIVGIGLLNYQESNSHPKIFRHILTQKAEIIFDALPKEPIIFVKPNSEALPKIETDSIIDLPELFDIYTLISLEKELKEIIENENINSIFKEKNYEILGRFAGRLSANSSYDETLEKPTQINNKPIISFSPCLILRKRNTQTFTKVYEEIIEKIQKSDDDIQIPSINNLIGFNQGNDNNIHTLNASGGVSKVDTIYFPKEYNKEQIEIIEKARKNNKVLVQGPPGTGKSHTIANLICHLLANGNRVLVTAYTKRALEVLKEKLPSEFQDLVVNFLGGDTASIQELQSSVNIINDQLSKANIIDDKAKIKDLESELEKTKESIARTINNLAAIKEKSSMRQTINKNYQGTLTEIAEKIENDIEKFDWFKDDYANTENQAILLKTREFFELNNNYDTNSIKEFRFEIPDVTKLPKLEEFSRYCFLESLVVDSPMRHSIITSSDFDKLIKNLKELERLYRDVQKVQIDFTNSLIQSYLNGGNTEWVRRLNQSKSILERLEKHDLKEFDKNVKIIYPIEKELQQLKADAKILINYLNQGNQLSGLSFNLKKPFLTTQIKQRLYFIDEMIVNGSPCDTLEEFEVVLRDISFKEDFDDLASIWKKEIPTNISLFDKFNYFKQIHEEVQKLLNLIEFANVNKYTIESISSLKINIFEGQELIEFIPTAEFSKQYDEYLKLIEKVRNSKTYLSRDNIHQVRDEIISAFDMLDSNLYSELLAKVGKLNIAKTKFLYFENLRSQVNAVLPNTAGAIETRIFTQEHLDNLENAILFKHAKIKASEFMALDNEVLIQDLYKYEIYEKKLISKIASLKAWDQVVERLQREPSLRQHLNAWVLAVSKIGKTGTGKTAEIFKRIAQQEMEYCKDSIPCWIMPLYKVAEAISPEQEKFDYVIIDEASQLGPDAIFLLYLSKNVIIVGDDKQTSPEYIGIEADIMVPQIRRYLDGIRFNDFYGPPFSFFDLANLFCGEVTILREHFRCMPEIIEFSNRHFYAPIGKALYPLKQYSQNRLKPLVAEFCPDGYIDGSGSSIINKPEANHIVNTIAKIIRDEKYKGKTIGVITLQGNKQASLIETLLLKKIGDKEFFKRRIICGNSASFQGDERDIIFLSLVTAHNHSRAPLVKPEDERRFNVATTRAKEQLWLFHSVELHDLHNTNDLRYKLLNHIKHYSNSPKILSAPIKRLPGMPPKPFDSWFEVDVYNDIVARNLSVIPQYEVANGRYRIDFVALLPNGAKIAIECDGDKWHGPEQFQKDIQRQKELERFGWQFFRVRGYEYYTNRQKALEPFWNLIADQTENEFYNVDISNQSNTEPTTASHLVPEHSPDDQLDNGTEDPRSDQSIDQTNGQTDSNNSTLIDYVEYPKTSNKVSDKTKSQGSSNKIIRYFNLFSSGKYILTLDRSLNADFIIPIKELHSEGFLLQCYNSGHINKVHVKSLLAKKIGKEYMNGINSEDRLVHLEVIEDDKIIGISFTEDRRKKFKAHLTENISSRELLQLQGIKVIYNNFENIEYKIFPLEIYNDICRLVFQSFTASGKPFDNNYYSNEWSIIKSYFKEQGQNSDNNDFNIPNSLFTQKFKVSLNDVVTLKFLNSDKILMVKLVDFPTTGKEKIEEVQIVNITKPLARAILGKAIGEIGLIEDTNTQVEIVEIK